MSKETKALKINPQLAAFQEELLKNYDKANLSAKKGQTLFVGSSLMEIFPIEKWEEAGEVTFSHYIYNRAVRATTTSFLLEHIESQIFNLEPSKIFINIGTNDITETRFGDQWLEHLMDNYRRILEIVYEKLEKTVDKDVVVQYIQHPQIARDFASYLELFYKYRTDYQIDEVLSGHIDDILVKKAAHASFDEKLSVTGLLLSRLNKAFGKVKEEEEKLVSIFDILKEAKEPLMGAQKEQPLVYLEDVKNRFQSDSLAKKKAGLLSREDLHHDQQVLDTLEKYVMDLKKENVQDGESAFSLLRVWFNAEKEEYDNGFDKAAKQLEYAFDFMESAFAGGQELVVFITELNTSSPAVAFLQEYSCERYYRYNKELLFRENTRDILERIRQLG